MSPSGPTGERLVARLAAEGLAAQTWANGPGDTYAIHAHDYDKVIVVVRCGIRFGLPATGERLDLREGDRLELPAGTRHDALVGPDGVACLEGHRPAGSLGDGPRRRSADDW